jgi:hypothetical protein
MGACPSTGGAVDRLAARRRQGSAGAADTAEQATWLHSWRVSGAQCLPYGFLSARSSTLRSLPFTSVLLTSTFWCVMVASRQRWCIVGSRMFGSENQDACWQARSAQGLPGCESDLAVSSCPYHPKHNVSLCTCTSVHMYRCAHVLLPVCTAVHMYCCLPADNFVAFANGSDE